MLEGLRKFILGETAIVALAIVAIVLKGDVSPHVCYALATIAGGVSLANALKSKNGNGKS